MPLILNNILDNSAKVQSPLLLLQSTTTLSSLPILRRILANRINSGHGRVILLCTLYRPDDLLAQDSDLVDSSNLECIDWTAYILGYLEINWQERQAEIDNALDKVPSSQPVTFVIDSVDTLFDDFDSRAKTYQFIRTVAREMRSKKVNSQLICHLTSSCPLLSSLKAVTFSQQLTHITVHPTVVISHIAEDYLTPPPPLSPPEKFWRIFIPLVERHREVERLVYGPQASGSGGSSGSASGGGRGFGGGPLDEMVVEILVRGRATVPIGINTNRKPGIERVLEGWNPTKGGGTSLVDLPSLMTIMQRKRTIQSDAPDPTRHVSFNLNLTESQQAARSQVPLPYEHEGKPFGSQRGQIYYDPDSADDLDDEDPDEDLDI